MSFAQFANLSTIEFDDVAAENRRYVLLNMMPARSNRKSFDEVRIAVDYIVDHMDLKAVIYDEQQFEWLHAHVDGSSGSLTTVFYEMWMAVPDSDCVILTLRYSRIVTAIIEPE